MPDSSTHALPHHASEKLEQGYGSGRRSLTINPHHGPPYTITYGNPVTRTDQDGTVTVLVRGKSSISLHIRVSVCYIFKR